jgi:hypothetical protein
MDGGQSVFGTIYFLHRQAHSVVRNALIYSQFRADWRFHPKNAVGSLHVNFPYMSESLDDAGKHGCKVVQITLLVVS